MTGICFHLEFEHDGVGAAGNFGLDVWENVAQLADDIETIAIINRTTEQIGNAATSTGLCVYTNLDQFLDDHRGRTIVYVCATVGVATMCGPLWRCDEDIDWYVFGPVAGWDSPLDRKERYGEPCS